MKHVKKEYGRYVDEVRLQNAERKKDAKTFGFPYEETPIMSFKEWKEHNKEVNRGMAAFLHPSNWHLDDII